jgi:putative hemolysin
LTDKDGWAVTSILVCTLLNFFLSLAETSLNSLRSSRLQQYAQGEHDGEGAFNVEAIQALLRHPTRFVAAVQIGITIFSLTAVAVAIAVLAPDLAHFLHRLRVVHNVRISVSLLIVVVALLTLVIGELVPRAVAVHNSERIAMRVAEPLRWLERAERPLVALVLGLSNLVLKPFGLSAAFSAPVVTEEELKTLLDTSERQGVIEEDEKEMLRNVISFGDTKVHSVMTPRIDLKAAPAGTTVTELTRLIVKCGHTRIPIYEGSVDRIIGVVLAKDLLMPLVDGHKGDDVCNYLRAAYFVPDNKRVDELLEDFRRSNLQMAIVQDEYSGTAGLATIEDLLEEIVGEIQDEYDTEEQMIVIDDEGTADADGRAPLSDINDQLELELPTDDYDTIGGFIFGLFGRPPQTGEQIDYETVRFHVTKANGRRIQRVRIEQITEETTSPTPVAAAL